MRGPEKYNNFEVFSFMSEGHDNSQVSLRV